ncbi:TIGR04554 family membrane protein [Mycoplasma yeatsii]|uniref:Three transmembrane helix protein n=1 Tax=Mycoplasma yeatsii TaxID=51365 RepID=A0ABU0NF72_9MOLU|nr:TIGR04554 family membrane protein [Mycoplasma yeatsii]AJM71870.1 membrane protein [Mycoplasma yeatsii GM274B]MDQ0568024.1 three transmembrane helix protein [Mycoplasma yeatsii]
MNTLLVTAEIFGKDIKPVAIIALLLSLLVFGIFSFLVYKNKVKIVEQKSTVIVAINYIIAFIALVLSSVAISKYNSPGLGDLFSNNLPATLRGLAYSGLVFSLIASGMTGYLYSKWK